MKLGTRLRKTLAFAMATGLALGGVVYTSPVEVSAAQQTKNHQVRNVMYYGDWSVWGGQGNQYPDQIGADSITHLNFAFLDFDAQGNLIFTDVDAASGNPLGQEGVTWGDVNAGILPALLELREQHPNMKIGISVGGWSKSGDFSDMAANPTSRARFVENMMRFVEYTNMDFVDIDWEYPAFVRQPDLVDNKNDEGTPHSKPEDKENYILLLEDLRAALDKQGEELGKTYELSVALPAAQDKLEAGIDVQRMFEIIDFGNLMTYDLRGAFDEISGHQTALYPNPNDPFADRQFTIDETVQYMLEQGAPAEKLVIGAAYYSRGWDQVGEGTDPNSPGLFGPAELTTRDADQTPSRGAKNELPLANGDGGRNGGIWGYRNFDKLRQEDPTLVEYWDEHAQAPYMYSEVTGQFFTYDNVESIHAKADYVLEEGLGGIIAWQASNDKPTDSDVRDELTDATRDGLYGEGAELPDHEIVYSDLDISVRMTADKQQWSDNGSYTISITNNERLEETDAVLKIVEEQQETITLPMLYIKNTGAPLTKGDYAAGTVTQKGEYTVVDLGSIYDGKAIEPGQTYTFSLNTTGTADINNIESIELVQRISKNGAEIERQTIYGSTEQVNQKPVITGANDTTITVGDAFNPLAGVSATDKEDGNITSKMTVTGTVNTSKAGTYTLTYSVTDSEGLTTTATRKVTVKEKAANTAPTISGATDKTITVGDTFNPLAGVTATDKEDGNITSKLTVTGVVDTTKEGVYTLTYTVADSEGLTATATRKVTVKAEDVVLPENTAPTITGATDKTITVGDAFDALAGVKATDKEDGDITSSIRVTGTVDTTKAGTYTLTYTVADSEGLTATATRKVTVKAEVVADPSNTYDPNKVYNTGDKVMYQGTEYTAKWWTQGDTPGTADVWEAAQVVNPDGSKEYQAGATYNEGDMVTYQGQTYRANWWTQSTPGSDSSWTLQTVANEDGSQEYVEGKAYLGGDIVNYGGKQYKANWWTTSTPGSDASWTQV